jgi:hypothetical protein
MSGGRNRVSYSRSLLAHIEKAKKSLSRMRRRLGGAQRNVRGLALSGETNANDWMPILPECEDRLRR